VCFTVPLDWIRSNNKFDSAVLKGFAFVGSNAFRVENIISLKESLQELQKQYLCAEKQAAGRLKSEYKKALEKLGSHKEEYLMTLKNRFGALKDEYKSNIEKGVTTFREEYSTGMDKINSLKTEYLKAVDTANFLKDELIKLFERYSFFTGFAPRNFAANLADNNHTHYD
jgi:septation ring formation regulator EzrA